MRQASSGTTERELRERAQVRLGGGGRTKGPRTYFETGERSTLEYLYVFRWTRASSEMHSATALLVLGAMFLPLGLDEVGLNSGSVSPPDMVGGEGPKGGGVCEGKTGTL